MLLRTRIILIVSLSLVTLAAGLVLAALYRETQLELRYERAIATYQSALWRELVSSVVERVSHEGPRLVAESQLDQALETRNRDRVQDIGQELTKEFEDISAGRRLEIFDESGQVVYTSSLGVLQTGTFDPSRIAEVARYGIRIGGVQLDASKQPVIAVAFPVLGNQGPVGAVLVSETVGPLLFNLRNELNALCRDSDDPLLQDTGPDAVPCNELFLVGLRGGLLAGTSNKLWSEIDKSSISREEDLKTQHIGEQVFAIVTVPIVDSAGRPLAILVEATDITLSDRGQQLVAIATLSASGAFLLLLLLGLSAFLNGSFQPLNSAIEVLKALSAGNTSVSIDGAMTDDEIGRIASAVEILRERSIQLQRAERQKARQQRRHAQLLGYRQELDVAKRLQASILPSDFPPQPGLTLSAFMRPAKEVGGDFYDYFQLEDGRVGVVMADVSGKGVPAALFMAVSRTLIKVGGTAGASPGACLARANDLLVQDNEAMMFVTVFYAVVDPADGTMVYANAGHNPPYLVTAGGEISQLERTGDMALGYMDGIDYGERQIRLGSGDAVFLYTDGVTEAQNAESAEFLESRLETALTGAESRETEQVLEDVVSAVETFVAGADQSDDLTCLCLRYSGPAGETAQAAE